MFQTLVTAGPGRHRRSGPRSTASTSHPGPCCARRWGRTRGCRRPPAATPRAGSQARCWIGIASQKGPRMVDRSPGRVELQDEGALAGAQQDERSRSHGVPNLRLPHREADSVVMSSRCWPIVWARTSLPSGPSPLRRPAPTTRCGAIAALRTNRPQCRSESASCACRGGKSSTRPPDVIRHPLRQRLPVRGSMPTIRDARDDGIPRRLASRTPHARHGPAPVPDGPFANRRSWVLRRSPDSASSLAPQVGPVQGVTPTASNGNARRPRPGIRSTTDRPRSRCSATQVAGEMSSSVGK